MIARHVDMLSDIFLLACTILFYSIHGCMNIWTELSVAGGGEDFRGRGIRKSINQSPLFYGKKGNKRF